MSGGPPGYCGHVGGPRARTDKTPCVIHDGRNAADDDGFCVRCGTHRADPLKALVADATPPTGSQPEG